VCLIDGAACRYIALNYRPIKDIYASDKQSHDWFGFSLSAAGQTLAVGAPYEDTTAGNSGAVYIYERHAGGVDNFGQTARIKASDPQGSDHFAYSLSLPSLSHNQLTGQGWQSIDCGSPT